MNKLFVTTALAAAALLPLAAQAQAQETKPAAKPLTRAEVIAELQRARASGEYDALHADTPDPLGRGPQPVYSSWEAWRAAKAAEQSQKQAQAPRQ
jgi:hypothetical protein